MLYFVGSAFLQREPFLRWSDALLLYSTVCAAKHAVRWVHQVVWGGLASSTLLYSTVLYEVLCNLTSPHASRLTPHASHLTPHTSHLTPHHTLPHLTSSLIPPHVRRRVRTPASTSKNSSLITYFGQGHLKSSASQPSIVSPATWGAGYFPPIPPPPP